MAKYDHGGGCACGLYSLEDCECSLYKKEGARYQQPKFSQDKYHQLHDELCESIAVDGEWFGEQWPQFAGSPSFKDGTMQVKEYVLIVLDALEQMFINDTAYMTSFNHRKENENGYKRAS